MSDNLGGIVGFFLVMMAITLAGINIRFGLDRIAKAIEARNIARQSERRKT